MVGISSTPLVISSQRNVNSLRRYSNNLATALLEPEVPCQVRTSLFWNLCMSLNIKYLKQVDWCHLFLLYFATVKFISVVDLSL